MSPRQRVSVVVLLALLGSGLVGCGDERREAAQPTAAQPGAETAPAPSVPPAATEARPSPPTRARVVLESSLAGKWYTADPEQLRTEVTGFLDSAPDLKIEGLCALILPHAGYAWSGLTAGQGIRQAVGRGFRRVIVIGPTHSLPMENLASVPSATHYRTPLGEVPLDTAVIAALREQPFFADVPAAYDGEHSVQIEVPLLQQALGPFDLVPIVVGQLDRATAQAMARSLLARMDDRTLVVASSDFTHFGPRFGYVPFRDDVGAQLKKLDGDAFAAIETRSSEKFRTFLDQTGATICGREGIALLLEMLPADAKVRLLHYDTSGRISGDFENSVSYQSIAISGAWPKTDAPPAVTAPPRLTGEDHRRLLDLARRTVAWCLEKQAAPTAEDLGFEPSAAMRPPRAAFVTLKKDGALRGCIGGLYPSRPLFREIMAQAIAAAFQDRRFRPVAAAELAGLDVEISVLTGPRPVAGPEAIEIGRHGVILEKDGRRAVFLPQVAPEQGWDREETLTQLSRKAGLPAEAWKTGATFLVFEAEVFGEREQ